VPQISVLAWILLALTAAFTASHIVRSSGLLVDIMLGIVGAVLGGFLVEARPALWKSISTA
jgi:uncharacterized membrane protein YeaQ/YmgE (transglycosylase-associated protein family)